MKIEFLKDSPDGALIRLFNFSNDEVAELKKMLDQLVNGKIQSVPVHEHCKVNPKDNAHLTFLVGKENKGVQQKGSEFECILTKSSLSSVSELVGSFAFHPVEFTGYEWLDETSDISLLISPTGKW